jgi:hypothetical protein
MVGAKEENRLEMQSGKKNANPPRGREKTAALLFS